MTGRIALAVAALLAILLVILGGALYYFKTKSRGPQPFWSSIGLSTPTPSERPDGLSQLAARVPKNAGVFAVLDLRQAVDLKAEVSVLREMLKGNSQALQAWDEAEKELGLKVQDLAQWALPAAFVAVLPPNGEAHFWAGQVVKKPDGQLVACKSNLKNTATALEMYSTDNAGHYPRSLAALTPNYLKMVPNCPGGQRDTFSASYLSASGPDAYTLFCQGHNHPRENENFPQYTGMTGLASGVTEQEPPKRPEPMMVFGAPVNDEKLAREHFLKLFSTKGLVPQEESLGDVKFWVFDGVYLGLHQNFILGGNSRQGVEALLASFTGKSENLAGQSQFAAMRQKFIGNQAGLVYVPLQGLSEALPTDPTDDRAREALKGLTYLAGSFGYDAGQLKAVGFLALDGQNQSSFIKSLLQSPGGPFQSGEVFPGAWGNYWALNLRYVIPALLEGLRLHPTTQRYADIREMEKTLGVTLERDVWAAFGGEVAWSSNALEKFPRLLANAPRPAAAGQLTACKSNLKNTATALEMYSTDNGGRYPLSLAALKPNYLRMIPVCPAANQETYSKSYRMNAQPDNFTVYCQGKHHGAENFPQYSATKGLEVGDTHEETPPAVLDPNAPSYLVMAGVKDAAKAESIISKLAGTPKAGPKIGHHQVYEYWAPLPVFCCTVETPSPMVFLAIGPEAQQLLREALEVKNPLARLPRYQATWKNQPERWVSAGYLDLAPLLKSLKAVLEGAPSGKDTRVLQEAIGGLKEASSTFYLAVESDGLRLGIHANGSLAIGGLASACAILVPNFVQARSQGQLTACKSNLKNVATAMEMYASDNAGFYPTALAKLTPNYLRLIPSCPAGNQDTYSSSLRCAARPDGFTVFCQGSNHSALVSENYPQYNSFEGLVERL